MTLKETTNKILYQGQLSFGFTSNSGVKQGDSLSATLFNITLENIIRKSKIKTNHILKNSYQLLAYADDVVILSKTKEELKKILKRLEKQAKEAGIEINQQKSNYMILGNKDQNEK